MPLSRREFLKRIGSFFIFSAFLSSMAHVRSLLAGKEKVIRPPGAVVEEQFLRVCIRCGKCVEACPTHVIKPLEKGLAIGTPYIDYSEGQDCIRCMDCTNVCPTNALMKIREEELNIGTAIIDYGRCIKCFICFYECPVEAVKTMVEDPRIMVIEEKCIGCGTCTSVCPTDPPAITVKPEGAYRPEWSPP